MSTNFASLGIAVESSQAAKAADDLDKLVDSAEGAQKAIDDLGTTGEGLADTGKKVSQSAENASLYEENYEAAGFVHVDRPQRGDLIVMQIGRTVHPNHAGIFLGADPALPGENSDAFGPGPFLLHHLYGRPSEIIVFGGPWNDRTRLILRHREAHSKLLSE